MGAGVSLFFECPPKLEKAVLSQLCPLPSLSEKKKLIFFLIMSDTQEMCTIQSI